MKKYLDLYVVNGMYWVTAAAFLPFIGAYYTSIGMSEGQVGVLAAVFPLAALAIQPTGNVFLLSCCMRSFLQRCFPSAMRWLSRRPKEGGLIFPEYVWQEPSATLWQWF